MTLPEVAYDHERVVHTLRPDPSHPEDAVTEGTDLMAEMLKTVMEDDTGRSY